MKIDTTTKVLLALIAMALFLNAIVPSHSLPWCRLKTQRLSSSCGKFPVISDSFKMIQTDFRWVLLQ